MNEQGAKLAVFLHAYLAKNLIYATEAIPFEHLSTFTALNTYLK